MKTRFLPLFLLPAFLIGCNTSWHNINRDKALEIANNIIQYNKHNRFTHLIQDNTYLYYTFDKGKKVINNIKRSHAMYDLNRGYYQNTTIRVDNAKSSRMVSLNFTVYFVDASSVINASIDYNIGSSGAGITGQVYPAANENEARKIFENVLDTLSEDKSVNFYYPTNILEQLDDTLSRVDYCNYMKEKYSDPTTYGSYDFSAKNNNSLSTKINLTNCPQEQTGNVTKNISYIFDCNRCLKYEQLTEIYKDIRTSGLAIEHVTATYDYNTPVKFVPIIDLIKEIIKHIK